MQRRMSRLNDPTPPTVLVLRFSSAGDVLLTSAALEALERAWPDARIVVVTKAPFVDLVRTHPSVDAVVALAPGESAWSLRRRLSALQPTDVLDLHGKLRGALLRRLVAPRHRSAWRNRPWYRSLGVRLGLTRYRSDRLVADRYHEAVERLVGHAVDKGRLRYVVAAEHVARTAAVLQEAGVDLSRPVCGMSPGSQWLTKRWPADYYGALAAKLGDDGVQVVLADSRDEMEMTAAVQKLAPLAIDLGGRLGLGELGGFIQHCALFVANDSGPMHLARALGVPTLALFGSTDPALFDFTGHAAMFLGLECSPCSLYGRRRCPLGHFRCMRELDVERVYAAAKRLLGAPRPGLVVG